MAAGRKTGGGSRKGKPNHMTVTLKAMILGALDDVGGRGYLARQALEEPVAFLALLGRVLPTTLAGDDGQPIVVRIVRFGDVPPEISATGIDMTVSGAHLGYDRSRALQ